jgi:hypothetical protein
MKVPMKYQAPFPKCLSKCSATIQWWHVESLTILVNGLGCLLLLSSIQIALMSNFSYM